MGLWGQRTSQPQFMGLTGLDITIWILDILHRPLCGRLGSHPVVLLYGFESFRKWITRSRLLGHILKETLASCPSFFGSWPPCKKELSSTHTATMMFILVIAMKATEPSDLGLKTLKPWAKVTLFSFKVVFCLGHFITATESSPCGDQRFSEEGVSSRSWSTKGLWRRNWAPAPSAFFDALSGSSSSVLSHHWLKVGGPTGMTGSWKTLGQNESRFFIS